MAVTSAVSFTSALKSTGKVLAIVFGCFFVFMCVVAFALRDRKAADDSSATPAPIWTGEMQARANDDLAFAIKYSLIDLGYHPIDVHATGKILSIESLQLSRPGFERNFIVSKLQENPHLCEAGFEAVSFKEDSTSDLVQVVPLDCLPK